MFRKNNLDCFLIVSKKIEKFTLFFGFAFVFTSVLAFTFSANAFRNRAIAPIGAAPVSSVAATVPVKNMSITPMVVGDSASASSDAVADPSAPPAVDKVAALIGIPSFAINASNCETFYSICMNKYCVQDDDKAACSCSSSINNLTNNANNFYQIDGNPTKEGSDLLAASNDFCKVILDHCSGMEKAVKNSYNTTAESDCIGWAVKHPQPTTQSMADIADKLMKCMQPLCVGTKDDGYQTDTQWAKCFNLDEAEIKLNDCSSVIASSPYNLSLKDYFYKTMQVKQDELCSDQGYKGGNLMGSCLVRVEYGVTKDKILKAVDLKMGSSFMCSQEWLGTETPIIKSLAKANAKKMAKREKMEAINSAVQTVTQVINATMSVDGGKSNQMLNKIATVGDKVNEYAGYAQSAVSIVASVEPNSSLNKVGDGLNTVSSVANIGSALRTSGRSADKSDPGAKIKSTSLGGAINNSLGSVGGSLNVASIVANGAADTMNHLANAKEQAAAAKFSKNVRARGTCWINGHRVGQEGDIIKLLWTDYSMQ